MATITAEKTLEVFKRRDCGIYIIKNKVSLKMYVGQSRKVSRRFNQHKYNATTGSFKCGALYSAIRKHGVENFEFIFYKRCCALDLNAEEANAIKLFNTISPHGYNLTSGGDSKFIVMDSTKKKISNKNKGRIVRKETILKYKETMKARYPEGVVAWNKGKKMSGISLENQIARNKSMAGKVAWNRGVNTPDCVREKQSLAKKGKITSQETKEKISYKMKGRNISWGTR